MSGASIQVTRSVELPIAEIELRFSRSSGPGGQHAQKSSTRVEATFDVAASSALSEGQKARVAARLGPIVRAVAQDERSQLRNRQLAVERVVDELRRALRVERPRRATKPTKASQQRRLDAKRQRTATKQQRRRPDPRSITGRPDARNPDRRPPGSRSGPKAAQNENGAIASTGVDKWFESVAVAQRRARRVLPKAVYDALVAGSERGTTTSDNVAAFAELGFLPVVVDQPATREMATSVMGQALSMPVLISPTGVQAVHPEGEVAVARAAASRGIAVGLSSFASRPIEDVVAANPQTFFQTYWSGGRDAIVARLDRAKAAGAVGLILTTDWSFSHSRDWGSPKIPQRLDLATMIRQLPGVITKPRWLARWARAGWRPPSLGSTEPGRPGLLRADVLRGLRGVDADTAGDLG